jgi:streptogramin lyase
VERQDVMKGTLRVITVLVVAAAALTAAATAAPTLAVAKTSAAGKVKIFSDRVLIGPAGIVAWPDGALWYVNQKGHSIGRITTTGDVKSKFPNRSIQKATGIAAGPDGALWFTNTAGNSIGRITTSGTVATYTGTGIDSPRRSLLGRMGRCGSPTPPVTRSGVSPPAGR